MPSRLLGATGVGQARPRWQEPDHGKPRPSGLAKRHVNRKLGFLLHLAIYAVVNAGLIDLEFPVTPHRPWALAPLLGWGIGLLFHALSMFLNAPGARWKQRLVENEMNHNRQRNESLLRQYHAAPFAGAPPAVDLAITTVFNSPRDCADLHDPHRQLVHREPGFFRVHRHTGVAVRRWRPAGCCGARARPPRTAVHRAGGAGQYRRLLLRASPRRPAFSACPPRTSICLQPQHPAFSSSSSLPAAGC